MRSPRLEYYFPKLSTGLYSVESLEDTKYNCVAYAVGNPTRNWQWMPRPTGGFYWPPDIDGDGSIEDWAKVFWLHGYRPCTNGNFEKNLEKVVLYVDAEGVPSHVAKQDIAKQKWISKLGKGHDIEHDSLDVLTGFQKDEYGTVERFMARRHDWPRLSLWFRFRSFLARIISPSLVQLFLRHGH